MKKILSIIFIALCIFQMVVLATAIDVGDEAIDRGSAVAGNYTYINLGNPANDTGTLTSVEIWANSELSNCEVATFYSVGSNYSTRDTHAIGTVTAGSKQTFSGLSISVQTGDFIGIYYSGGSIEHDLSGYTTVVRLSGDHIPCSDTDFTGVLNGDASSIKGIGATAEAEDNVIFFGTNF